MRFYAYLRISSYGQAEKGDSIDGQKRFIKKWANDNGHEIVRWFKDQSVSAYKTRPRKEFDRMINMIETRDCEDDEVDGVVVYNLSRIFRNLTIQCSVMDKLEASGLRLISATEGLPENYTDSRLLASVLGIFNEHQSARNAETVRDRLYETAEKGYFTGGIIPFGYKTVEVEGQTSKRRKLLVINKEESIIVQMIFELAFRGKNGKPMGVKSIALYLNESNLLKRGRKWTRNAISNLLRNTVYIGKLIFGKKSKKRNQRAPVTIKCPAIISDELFYNVRDGVESRNLRNRKSSSIRSKHKLTGILKCGLCGSNMVIMKGKSGKYSYYDCGKKIRYGKGSCNCIPVRKEIVEDYVINYLINNVITVQSIMENYHDIKMVLNNIKRVSTQKITELSKGIEANKEKINRLLEKVADGTLEPTEMTNKFINTTSEMINKFEIELDTLRKASTLPIKQFGQTQAELLQIGLTNLLRNGADEDVKVALLELLSEVRVYPKKKILLKGNKIAPIFMASKTATGTDFSVPVAVSKWRRDRDLNPRYATNVCRFSRPVLSTTQPSLRKCGV